MKYILLGLLALLIAGCEAPATPIAAAPTVIDASPIPLNVTEAAPLRYGILANTAPYVTNLDGLRERVIIETISNTTPLTDYDLVMGYGVLDGWQQTDRPQQIALILNTERLDSAIVDVLSQIIDPQQVVQSLNIPGTRSESLATITAADARTLFANNGHPDGYLLTLAADPVPGIEQIAALFGEANINLNQVSTDDPRAADADLRVIRYVDATEREQWVTRFGEQAVINLYALPISYRATEGFSITLTADGWPLPTR